MTLMLIPRTRITRGTTNVFADLGYPAAAERQTKTRLALAVNELLKARKRHQLPRACNAPDSAKARMIDQTVGLLGKKFIEGQCSARVVGLNVVIDRTAVVYSL